LIEITVSQYPKDKDGYLTVMHAGVPENGAALSKELCRLLNIARVPVYNVPPAIVTHGGPGILAVSFFV
jgi:fatty acid-binding protein DegV